MFIRQCRIYCDKKSCPRLVQRLALLMKIDFISGLALLAGSIL